MSAEIVLQVSDLHKAYAAHAVLRGFSLVIRRGERVALLAPSGSGKTTLIRILAGLEPADSGSITLREPDPVTLFQEPRLFPFMTVAENLLLPFRARGQAVTPAVRRLYRQWLEVCELEGFEGHYPHQLSGGMQQKVALARGLLGSPRFVMMDEPFQSIGSAAKQAMIAFLLRSNPGLTLLFITHLADELPLLAQRVVHLPGPEAQRQPPAAAPGAALTLKTRLLAALRGEKPQNPSFSYQITAEKELV